MEATPNAGPARSKLELLESARMLKQKGYNIFATAGTHRFFEENGNRITFKNHISLPLFSKPDLSV
ncbi:hypothetical protein [Saccharicrinis sp. FJH54]|uniref:hypothetical protein n=1 Tax=Saccharicrinis sp. FJH54 TaxID=3344665 RepID=UPI0035D4C2DD